ncbi:MAG: iron-containing redox enzyme family protein [Pseudomonadota bacterium]
MTTVDLMQSRIRLLSGELVEALDSLWESEEVARLFPEYLIMMHQVIRASVPLMEEGLREARKLDTSDPLGPILSGYFAEHIEEEQSHDEWTLDDLEAAGYNRAEIMSRIPAPPVANLVGAQYYWLRHYHPVGLLGYIYLLEANPGDKHLYDEIEARSGLPSELFRTYRMHGELDPEHKDELEAIINSLPLTDTQRSLICVSLIHAMSSLADSVRHVMRS